MCQVFIFIVFHLESTFEFVGNAAHHSYFFMCSREETNQRVSRMIPNLKCISNVFVMNKHVIITYQYCLYIYLVIYTEVAILPFTLVSIPSNGKNLLLRESKGIHKTKDLFSSNTFHNCSEGFPTSFFLPLK